MRLLCGQPGKVTEINVDILTDTLEKVNEDNIKLHITQRDWDTVQDMEDNKSFSASPPKTQRSPVSTTEVGYGYVGFENLQGGIIKWGFW